MFRIAVGIIKGSLRNLRRSPLRSALAVLSAILGSAGVITSVNYALGGRQKVIEQLGRLGTNVLIVTPRQSRSIAGRARTGDVVTTLSQADYDALLRTLPIFSASSAFSGRPYVVKAGDLVKNSCTVIGITPSFLEIKRWPVQEGASFNASDVRRMERVALLGSKVSRDLFGESSPLGQRILINRVPFMVVGVLAERGQGLDAANEDDQIYVPLTVAMRRLANIDYFSGILFTVSRWEDMDAGSEGIRQLLHQRHAIRAALADDFQVQNQKQLLDTQLMASDSLLFYVKWISAGTLVISGLGTLAISWMGVKERTREIGTRRALGATQANVFLQFSTEAALLSLTGILLGVVIGLQAGSPLAKWANQPAVFDKSTACLATVISLALNLIFAAIPARSAAHLDPIRALRFE
jgi:putative ABC transport system permease protein